jgi:hypothetical protein
MIARTELTVQDCQDGTASIRLLKYDSQGRTNRRGQQKKTARMIQSELDSQNISTRTGQADRTDRTGLPAWTVRTGYLEQDGQDRTAGTRQPEQESLNRTARIRKAK